MMNRLSLPLPVYCPNCLSPSLMARRTVIERPNVSCRCGHSFACDPTTMKAINSRRSESSSDDYMID